jgi:hypothetical protein
MLSVNILSTKRLMEMRCPEALVVGELRALKGDDFDSDAIGKIQSYVFYNYDHSLSTKSQIVKACSEIEDEFMLSLMGL